MYGFWKKNNMISLPCKFRVRRDVQTKLGMQTPNISSGELIKCSTLKVWCINLYSMTHEKLNSLNIMK